MFCLKLQILSQWKTFNLLGLRFGVSWGIEAKLMGSGEVGGELSPQGRILNPTS